MAKLGIVTRTFNKITTLERLRLFNIKGHACNLCGLIRRYLQIIDIPESIDIDLTDLTKFPCFPGQTTSPNTSKRDGNKQDKCE